MDIKEYEAILEALLFSSGEPVQISKLSEIIGLDRLNTEKILTELSDRYNYERRGITILKLGDNYQMATRAEFSDYIKKLLDKRKDTVISGAALEVLAIIAYKQPITRAYVEQVRGVDSSGVMATLAEKGLIEERGRLDVPGHPKLFGTTPDFMRSFGLSSLTDLPDISEKREEQLEFI